MRGLPSGLLTDLRFVRSKDVATWYGEVVPAWDSLPPDADDGWEPRWRNLGYWTAETPGLDAACRDLANRLADAAGAAAGLDVLDVGCGSGASTYLLRERLHANGQGSRLVGLDLTPRHIEHALSRDGAGQPEFILGSAVDLPFPAASFDRVLALECAFHFPSRPRFFAEAYRVLRGGGVLGVADVLVTPGFQRMMRASDHLPRRVRASMHRMAADILKMPTEGLVDLPAYLEQIKTAGFRVHEVEDITDHVFPYFMRYWKRSASPARQAERLRATGLSDPLAWQWARAWSRQMSVLMLGWHTSRYVIVTAERPERPAG